MIMHLMILCSSVLVAFCLEVNICLQCSVVVFFLMVSVHI